MKIEESETLQCLINAFAGESQARNRYTFYAKQAEKEGFNTISAIFLETADNKILGLVIRFCPLLQSILSVFLIFSDFYILQRNIFTMLQRQTLHSVIHFPLHQNILKHHILNLIALLIKANQFKGIARHYLVLHGQVLTQNVQIFKAAIGK